MPLEYPGGTIAEHMACRSDAVVFDVSHLGTVRVGGDGALAALQRSLTNDLGKIAPGRAQYTHLLDDADGSVLDDIIVWWHPRADDEPDVFDVMPNASNTDRVRAAVGGEETTHTRAVLAVQGPRALERLAEVFPDAAAVGRFRVAAAAWEATPCDVAGTGYTGERGVEIAVPAAAAEDLWEAIVGCRHSTGGAGCPRHVAAGGRPPTARQRARSWDHAAAGRTRVGRGVGQAGVRRARRSRRRARSRRRSPARRDRHRRSTTATVRVRRARRRRPGRHRHERQLLTRARSRHRPRLRPARTSPRARRSRSTCAAPNSPGTVVPTPFVRR